MTYQIEDLIKLYREVSKVIDIPQNNLSFEILLENLKKYGKTISYRKLVEFSTYLNDKFPYHGFITETLLSIRSGNETVSLSDKEISLLVSLVKHHIVNREIFQKL